MTKQIATNTYAAYVKAGVYRTRFLGHTFALRGMA